MFICNDTISYEVKQSGICGNKRYVSLEDETPGPNRKTLRGKRRGGKKNISVEERERLACAMQRCLGKQNLGPESHH